MEIQLTGNKPGNLPYALQERSQYMFSCIVNFLTLWRIKNTVAANGQIDTIYYLNGLR